MDAKYLKSKATCLAYAVYYKSCECGHHLTTNETFEDKKAGYAKHDWQTEWSVDEEKGTHYYACNYGCSSRDKEQYHSCDLPVCGQIRVCDECGVEYGDAVQHDYAYAKDPSDPDIHIKYCSRELCDYEVSEAHSGGNEPTCTTGSICRYCQKQYESALGHVPKDEITEWQCNDTEHYKQCTRGDCTYVYEETRGNHTHEDFVCGEASPCDVCGREFKKYESHSFSKWAIDTTDPTNYHTRICANCETVEKVAHKTPDEITEWSADATEHYKKCPDCSYEYTETRSSHHYETPVCGDYQTCATCGVKYRDHVDHDIVYTLSETSPNTKHLIKCNRCDYESEGVHSGGKTPTCTEGTVCDVCKLEYKHPLGHTPLEEIKEWSADRTEHYKVCERKDCGYIYDESREDHEGGSETCTAGKICAICQKEYTDAAGHKWNTLKWDHDEKFHFRRCSVCDVIDDESKTAHEYTQEVISSKYYAREATCTTPTQYYKSCECGHYSDQTFNVGEALGHTRGDKWINTDPTNHYYLCEVCSSRLDEKKHVLDQLIVSDDNVASEATCTQSAKYYLSCACGYNPKSKDHVDESGEPLGHWWDLDTYRVDTANTKHYFGCNREGCTAVYEGSEGLHSGGEATCISAGYCLVCGHDYLKALGHTADTSKWIVDYENNVHYHSCVRCTEHMDVTAHNYDQKVTTADYLCTEATCEKKATYYYSCVCGLADKNKTPFESGEPNGHKMAWTYTEEEHVQKCSVCDEPDEKTRGKHEDIHATCLEDAVCSKCGYVVEAALGHAVSEWVPKEGGELHYKHCTNVIDGTQCEYIEAEEAHNWGEYSRTQDPTCIEEGVDTRYCTVCGEASTRSVAMVSHEYDENDPVIEATVDTSKSTADETWYIHIIYAPCRRTPGCTARQEMGRTDSVLYNNFDSEIKYPTCTEDGYVRILPPADIVNAQVYETVLPAHGHQFGEDGLCVYCGEPAFRYSEGLEFISNGDGTCYVAGIGTCTDTDILIPPVSSDGDTVTGIGEYAFWYDQWAIDQDSALASITSVTIPDTVTDIGGGAFSDSPLTEVHIPNGVKNIGSSAFSGCANLKYIVLPESVTVIEENVFAYSALTSIEILGKITKIGARAFSGTALTEISIESNDVVIDFDAFSSCWQLEEITIHGNIREIADRAFAYGSTANITIYGNIYYVGYEAFYERYSTIHVYGDITFAGGYSFARNEAVYIHGNVGKIGDAAFRDCHLTDLTPFYSATHIDVAAFQDNDFEEIDLRKFENLVFIGGRVFARNHSLKSVWIPKEFGMQCTLPDGETMLYDDEFNYSWDCWNGMSIFENCTNLENVYLEDGLTFIPWNVFEGCESLEQIDIPDSVTTIGSYAFAWCSIKSVILPENLTTLYADAFEGCSDELYHTVGKLKFIDDWLVGYIYGDSGEIEDDAQNIIIPEGTKGIACGLEFPYAKTVQIPVSLKYINWGVFGYSYELTEVYYLGTESEWNNIVIDENNDYLLNATIHFLGESEPDIPEISYSEGLVFTSNGDGTCYVAGIGTCTDTDILIPPVSPDGDTVTAIGNDAFCGNTAITSVVIPEGVLTIGEYAFASSSLQNIVISASVTEIGVSAFEYCGSLGNCTIPENSQLTVLGETAFAWCGNLTSIYIPAGVTAIEAATFRVCQSLERVTFASDSSLVSIDAAAFVYCESLTDLVLPESLTHIGAQAFGQCALESISIPAGVVSIDDVAFQECLNLRSVEFPENSQLTHIGDSAFSTSGIRSISIPASVESIGDYAFSYCYSLESLTFPEDSKLTSIGEGAFDESYMLNCSITLPIGLKVIADYAFRHCGSLVIVIPENSELTTIGNGAFKDLWIMTEINIPAGVTAINEEAFSGMEALTDIYYDGTQEDWNKITIGTNNDPLLNATIHFKEPEIQYSQGLAFTSNGDGTCYVAGIGTCTDTDILIPPVSPDGDTVTGIGDNAFKGCTNLTWITIPDSVTSIGAYAFYNCAGLTSITIPDSVTNIGKYAFYGCTKLEELYFNATAMNDLSSSNYVFSNAGKNGTGIRVVIGKNVTKIPAYLFNPNDGSSNAPKIVNVDFEEGSVCESIGSYAFPYCTSMTSITIPDSVTSIGRNAFYNCTGLTSITIPEGVTSIGGYAFSNCTKLETINFNATAMNDLSSSNYVFASAGKNGAGIRVVIGKNVTKIPMYLFNPYGSSNYAPKIVSVEFEEGSVCESIGSYAFAYCTSMTSITIPNSVTSIGGNAFIYCTSMTSITIPEGVTKIGNYAFAECTGLESLTVATGNTTYYSQGNCIIRTETKEVAVGCLISEIPNDGSVTGIGVYAFAGWNSLKGITIPDSVTSIGAYAFYNCAGLTSITIPDSVTNIGKYAFYGCTKLEELYFNATAMNDLSSSNYVFYKAGQNGTGIRVVIGKNVTKIPAYLFNPYDYSYSAPKIVNVEFEEESVCESIGSHAFAYCTSMTSITIPNSVTSIGGIAFYNCSTLTDVYYDGTEEEWNKITIATNNTPLQNATIHFKEPETDPNEPGTEEPEQPEIDELILIVGNNNIIITDEILDEGGTIYQLVVTEEGTYTVMGDFFVQFQDAMGMTYSNCSYLTEGTYDVILNTMLIPAAGNYNIEVAYTAPESGDDLEPDPEPSGNPVIDSLPFTYEIPEGGLTTDGVYYDFIAKEDVTLIISCPEDGLMGLSGNTNDYDTDVDGNYILSVPAGETVTLNFWSMNSGIVGCYNVYVMSA